MYLFYMSYQKVVLSIFAIVLVIILVVYGVTLYNASSTDIYPPVQATCPDWWVSDSETNKNMCINEKNIGSHTCSTTMDFDTDEWNGADHICKKKQWAESCDLTWDGITNSTMKC
jgi:hypothetical protein